MKKRNVEVECKLIARDAAALADAPKALREVCSAVRSLGCEVIRDAYLDTPDWRIFRAGYACRIRRTASAGGDRPTPAEGGRTAPRRVVLTLKALTRPRAMVSTREELEQAIPSPGRTGAEDLAAALRHESALGEKIRGILGGKKPRVIFRIRNRRTTYAVRFGEEGFHAHVSLDDFTILAAGKKRRLAEMEIEITSGTTGARRNEAHFGSGVPPLSLARTFEADLRRLAKLLATRVGLGTGSRAKFQQGLELAGLRVPPSTTARYQGQPAS